MPLCDTALRLAQRELYTPRWSAHILEEARRNLIADGRCTEEQAQRRFDKIRQAFPDAEVCDYEDLIPSLTCNEKDRHVLAAAIRGRADQIVTQNLHHFPTSSLEPYGIEVCSPDDFLLNTLDLYPRQTAEIMLQQAAALRRPELHVEDVLRKLSQFAPRFSQQVETVIRAL